MKSAVLLLTVLLCAGCSTRSPQEKRKYDRIRSMYAALPEPYTVVQIDSDVQQVLDEIENNWICKASEPAVDTAELLQKAGFDPSVRGWVEMCVYRMPDYSWTQPDENRKALQIATAQGILLPLIIDAKIYVSEDRHLAFILLVNGDVAEVYRDKHGALIWSLWVRPEEHSEQEAATEPDEPSE